MASSSLLLCLVLAVTAVHADVVLTDQFWFTVTIDGVQSSVPYMPLAAGSTGMPKDGITNAPLVSLNSGTASCVTESNLPYMNNSVALLYDISCYLSIKEAVAAAKNRGALAAIWCFTYMPDTPINYVGIGIRTYSYGEYPVVSARIDRDCAPLYTAIAAQKTVTTSFKGSGTIKSAQLTALKTIVNSMPGVSWKGADGAVLTNDRPWTDVLVDGADDPCQRRLQGLWCEEGNVMFMYLIASNVNGQFSPAYGDLPELRFLKLNSYTSLTGTIPANWGNLNKLTVLHLSATGLSGLPSAISGWSALEVLNIDQDYSLTALPTAMSSLTSLRYISTANSPVGVMPPFGSYPNLQRMFISNSGISESLPVSALAALNYLEVFDGSHNNFIGQFTASSLDPLSKLTSLRLRSNPQLTGVLPNLANNVKLKELDLSYCGFTGGIPQTWLTNFKSLTQLRLAGNSLDGNTGKLASLTSLTMLDLSHNKLQGKDALSCSGLISMITPTSLWYLDISHNRFSLKCLTTLAIPLPTLAVVDMSHNNFSNLLPIDYTSETMKNLFRFDVSYNSFVGNINPTPPLPWMKFWSAEGNTLLKPGSNDPQVPSWAKPVDGQWEDFSTEYEGLQCPVFCDAGTCSMIVGIPATYYDYSLCRCAPGFTGTVPDGCVESGASPRGFALALILAMLAFVALF